MLALLCGASAAVAMAHAATDTQTTPPALRPSSGTPPGIAPATDCAMRELSYNYSNYLQPWNAPNVELFDALQLSFCGHARPAERLWSSPWSPPAAAATDARALFVDAEAGDDGGRMQLARLGQGGGDGDQNDCETHPNARCDAGGRQIRRWECRGWRGRRNAGWRTRARRRSRGWRGRC